MPITALDDRTALIVVDLQAGSVGVDMAPHAAADVVARSARLADAFRGHGLPVVLVNVAATPGVRSDHNPEGTPFVMPEQALPVAPELGTGGKRITKRTPGAFTGTDLETYLREEDVTQVVVTGVATGDGVAATVQQAFELGFHVTTPTDAMSDPDPARHAFSVAHHFPQRAETGGTEDVIALLAARPVGHAAP
ncbi:Nicotinamidase-related amidase [Actinacidiphila yanglinensis]|uniref:Nicotinamidase-related amidase n=1 Tax=Actinacidiphila yanglinensis TaxID=310779 RepID=A0A1H6D9T6_9ACTN|nr:isochorismatase family protein [Actinacidiphila yanglinensis]SEG82010.1 Nicotinamidase-related amidase [Actinacidiphila yanglinensis]